MMNKLQTILFFTGRSSINCSILVLRLRGLVTCRCLRVTKTQDVYTHTNTPVSVPVTGRHAMALKAIVGIPSIRHMDTTIE